MVRRSASALRQLLHDPRHCAATLINLFNETTSQPRHLVDHRLVVRMVANSFPPWRLDSSRFNVDWCRPTILLIFLSLLEKLQPRLSTRLTQLQTSIRRTRSGCSTNCGRIFFLLHNDVCSVHHSDSRDDRLYSKRRDNLWNLAANNKRPLQLTPQI